MLEGFLFVSSVIEMREKKCQTIEQFSGINLSSFQLLYVYIYMYVCMHLYIYIYTYADIIIYVYIYIYTHINVCIYVHMDFNPFTFQ